MAFPGLEFSFLAKFFKFFKRLSLFEEMIIPGFQEEREILEPASKGKSSRSRKKAEPSGSTKIFWASFWGSKWGIIKSSKSGDYLEIPFSIQKAHSSKAHSPTAHRSFTYNTPFRSQRPRTGPKDPVQAPKTPVRAQNPIQAPKPPFSLKEPCALRPLQIKKSLIRLRWCPSLRKSPRRKSLRQEISSLRKSLHSRELNPYSITIPTQ